MKLSEELRRIAAAMRGIDNGNELHDLANKLEDLAKMLSETFQPPKPAEFIWPIVEIVWPDNNIEYVPLSGIRGLTRITLDKHGEQQRVRPKYIIYSGDLWKDYPSMPDRLKVIKQLKLVGAYTKLDEQQS